MKKPTLKEHIITIIENILKSLHMKPNNITSLNLIPFLILEFFFNYIKIIMCMWHHFIYIDYGFKKTDILMIYIHIFFRLTILQHYFFFELDSPPPHFVLVYLNIFCEYIPTKKKKKIIIYILYLTYHLIGYNNNVYSKKGFETCSAFWLDLNLDWNIW